MESSPRPDRALKPALDALARRDPDIALAYRACGLPPRRASPRGFPGLLRVIVGQQVSAAAARAILTRLETACRPLTPASFLALSDETLGAVGLSRAKVRYGRGLAAELAEGRLDLAALERLDDAAAVAALTRIKGLGRWSAECYLLFALARPDVWPADDLAVQTAAQRLKALPARPGRREMDALAEPWRPHRSAAARFLWHLYRHPGVV